MARERQYGSTAETARYLGWKPQTLRKKRHRGDGPPYYRTGDGPQARVLYDLEEVQEWLATRRFKSTSEETVKAAMAERGSR